jgi:hypothetical protein
MRLQAHGGQASVELVAILPVLVLLAGALWQIALAGQAAWLTGAAARAAARAEAVGGDPLAAARHVVPGPLAHGLRVRADRDGSVRVWVPVPLVIGRGRLTTFDQRARFASQSG